MSVPVSSGKFEVLKSSRTSRARVGRLHTAHGVIETPVFMPVGTQATVKGVLPAMLMAANTQILLSNTYHLAVRPGTETIETLGGLHRFMNWSRPILTDSGGFQVFSLGKIRAIDADGVTFRSHLSGDKIRFTPKSVIDHQRRLGSDIMMPLDICTPAGASMDQTAADLAITHQWESDAYDEWQRAPADQLLFGIVQGGIYDQLREASVDHLTQHNFSGFAIGGVSVGESMAEIHRITELTAQMLPESKPRYLMGVGRPENLPVAIHSGIDMFDCVLPTRLGRHGQALTSVGKLNIRNHQYQLDPSPLDPACGCDCCTQYSKAYLRHLVVAGEMVGALLLSYHNIYFLVHMVDKIRNEIMNS